MVRVCDISFNKAVTDSAHRDFFSNYFSRDPSYAYGDTIVLKKNGRIISAVTILRRNIMLDGKKIPAGCIANVCTLPEERHKGYIRILMEKAREVMKEKNFRIGFLLGRPEIYEKFGWKNITGKSIEAYGPPDTGGRNISIREASGRDIPRIKTLYDAHYTRLNGFFERTEKYWNDFLVNFRSSYLGEFGVFVIEKALLFEGYTCMDKKSKSIHEIFFRGKPENSYFHAAREFLKADSLKLHYYDPLYIPEMEKGFGKITYPEINHKMFILPQGRISSGDADITSEKQLQEIFRAKNYTFSLCDKF